MHVRDGRLGLDLFDDTFVQDPYPLYERMHARRTGSPVADSGFYAVCGWDAVDDVIARPQDFSSNLTATMTYQGGKVGTFPMGELGGDTQALATADDPAHAVHRKLLVPRLAAKRIRSLETYVGETESTLWDEGVRDGAIEWMSAMANRLPMKVVGRLIGVPDEDTDQLGQWGYASHQSRGGPFRSGRTRRGGSSRDGTRGLHHRPVSDGGRRPEGRPFQRSRNGLCRRRIGRRSPH